MLHSVIGGSQGPIHSLENEMDEIRWIQDQHVKCLVEETNMSSRHLKKLLGRKVNVYLNAEEAVELERRFINSIKSGDGRKFKRGIQKIKESKKNDS